MKNSEANVWVKKTTKLEKVIEKNLVNLAKLCQGEEEKLTFSDKVILDKKRKAKISYKIEVMKR